LHSGFDDCPAPASALPYQRSPSRVQEQCVPRLIVIRGVDEGKQFELSGPTVSVGRHSANTVSLHDTQVSRRHLELRAGPHGYELVDLGSGNGTLLNGQLVQSAP